MFALHQCPWSSNCINDNNFTQKNHGTKLSFATIDRVLWFEDIEWIKMTTQIIDATINSNKNSKRQCQNLTDVCKILSTVVGLFVYYYFFGCLLHIRMNKRLTQFFANSTKHISKYITHFSELKWVCSRFHVVFIASIYRRTKKMSFTNTWCGRAQVSWSW